MKRWLTTIALLGATWVQFAQAASVASVYDQLAPQLTQASALQNSDPVKALSLLTSAENNFREGAEALPPVLRTGVSQALTDAKLALSRRSFADLEARLQLIRGIFGKALYDSYFDALSNGDTSQAQQLLPRTVAASGLSKEVTAQASALASKALKAPDAPNRFDGLRRFFERTYAQGITAALQRAQGQSSLSKAYIDATRAYSLYLVVQDSPRANNLDAQAFVDALDKLSKGDLIGFKTDVKSLLSQSQSFLKAVTAQVPSPNKPVAATKPSVKPTEPAPQPVVAKPTPQPVKPVAKPAPQPTPEPVAKPNPPVSVTSQPVPQPVGSDETFLKELSGIIPDPSQAKMVALSLSREGVHSLADWKKTLRELEGQVGEAQTLGPTSEAKQLLGSVSTRYLNIISPVVEAINPGLVQRTGRLLDAAQNAVALRGTDYSTMASALTENGMALENRSLGGYHAFLTGLTQALLGLPKALLFILAAILAIFPLYLMALTFGGRNIYWRYLGLAFLMLFLPLMFEGLGYFGSILADPQYGGLSVLNGLSQLSIQHSPLAQLIWILLSFAAIGFATVGLRGIASQFGLLQSQRNLFQRKNPTLSPTQTIPGTTATLPGGGSGISQAKVNPGLTSETVVEWDEEF